MSDTTTSPSAELEQRGDEPTVAIERQQIGTIALPGEREMKALWRTAQYYAEMPGLGDQYKGNPRAVMAGLITCYSLDLPTTPVVLNQFYEVKGKLFPSVQILVTLAAKHGVEVWYDDDECDESQAVAYCRRLPNGRVSKYRYTFEMAQKAGLVTDRSAWATNPDIMCLYRAAGRLLKTRHPDVVLGIPSAILDGDGVDEVDRDELQAQAVEVLDSNEVDAGSGADAIEDADVVDEEPEDTFAPPPPRVLLASEAWARDVLAHCGEVVPDGVRAGALAAALVRHVTKGERSELSTVRRGSEQLALKDRFVEYRNGRWTLDIDDQGVATLVEATPDASFTVSQDGADGGLEAKP